jgi:hypothetical protein
MKTLQALAGKRPRINKLSTDNYEARYWGCLFKKGRKFTRSDGTESSDRTFGFHSRPGKKEAIRNANRSVQKSARMMLKRQLADEVNRE